MKTQSGFIQIILILGIIAALALIGYLLITPKKISVIPSYTSQPYSTPATETQNPEVGSIKTNKDLNNSSNSLDELDTAQIDAQLNLLESESSSF